MFPNRVDVGGGWSVVRLISDNDLQTEGERMRHDVGSPHYIEKVEQGHVVIYSLRDRDNSPHVTFEITREHVLGEIVGRDNRPVKPEHAKKLAVFFSALASSGLDVTRDSAFYFKAVGEAAGFDEIAAALQTKVDEYGLRVEPYDGKLIKYMVELLNS